MRGCVYECINVHKFTYFSLLQSKHPQSLLKHQQPLAPAAQASTAAILVAPMATGNMITTTSTSDKNINNGIIVKSTSFTSATASNSCVQNISSNNCPNSFVTSSYSTPTNIGCLKIKSEHDFVQPQSSGLPYTTFNRAAIQSSLISNQPVGLQIGDIESQE